MTVQLERHFPHHFEHRWRERAYTIGRKQPAWILDLHHVNASAVDQFFGLVCIKIIGVYRTVGVDHSALWSTPTVRYTPMIFMQTRPKN